MNVVPTTCSQSYKSQIKYKLNRLYVSNKKITSIKLIVIPNVIFFIKSLNTFKIKKIVMAYFIIIHNLMLKKIS